MQAAPLGWKRPPANTAKPAKGFKYKGAGTVADPCKVVLIKEKVIKAVCRKETPTTSGVSLNPPFSGDVAAVLSVGIKNYRAQFDCFAIEVRERRRI